MATEKRKNFLSDLSHKITGSDKKSANNNSSNNSNISPTSPAQQSISPRPPPVQLKPKCII